MAETKPGGVYKVGDTLVNAEGKPVKGGESQDRNDLSTWTRADLEAEAERRGVEVKRGDGGDGAPLKEDYVRALS